MSRVHVKRGRRQTAPHCLHRRQRDGSSAWHAQASVALAHGEHPPADCQSAYQCWYHRPVAPLCHHWWSLDAQPHGPKRLPSPLATAPACLGGLVTRTCCLQARLGDWHRHRPPPMTSSSVCPSASLACPRPGSPSVYLNLAAHHALHCDEFLMKWLAWTRQLLAIEARAAAPHMAR
jgi:hypothetical protein